MNVKNDTDEACCVGRLVLGRGASCEEKGFSFRGMQGWSKM